MKQGVKLHLVDVARDTEELRGDHAHDGKHRHAAVLELSLTVVRNHLRALLREAHRIEVVWLVRAESALAANF